MGKLPHEIRDMLDDAEEVADFLQGFLPRATCTAPTGDLEETEDEGCWMVLDPQGNPWPLCEVEDFAKWEQSIRNLRQMVMHNG